MSRKGIKPRFDFTPIETHAVTKGEVGVNGQMYVVTFPRASGSVTAKYRYDFTRHPFRDLIPDFLLGDSPGTCASSINSRCRILQLLEEFFNEMCLERLNPETFKSFIHWLYQSEKLDSTHRFSESSIPTYVNLAKNFYLSGLNQKYPGWSQHEQDLITEIIRKELHGAGWRSTQESVDRTLSSETFKNLMKAVELKFNQCHDVSVKSSAGRRVSLHNLDVQGLKRIDPNPYVVFALLFGLCFGGRSAELNALTLSDIRVDTIDGHHELYLHAPNKQDSYLPVNEMFLRAFELCQKWSAEARQLCGPQGAVTQPNALLVCLATTTYLGREIPLIPFSTYLLNDSYLPYFYRKWFAHKVIDDQANEGPLLHAEGDPTKPLQCSMRKIRNAFGACFARQESDGAVTSTVMRHNDTKTTNMYYLQQTRLEHAGRVHSALEPEAMLLAKNLKNPAGAGVSKETLRKAREYETLNPPVSDDHVPEHDQSETAKQDSGDLRPNSGLGPKQQHRVSPEEYLKKAQDLEAKGDLKGAENARRRADICPTYITRTRVKGPGGDSGRENV